MQAQRYGWVETLTHTFLAWVAVLIFAVLVLLFVALLFLFASQPSLADDSYRVPSICKPLADKYRIPERVSGGEAMRIVGELDRYSWWPGVKQCRRAVQKEWKL